MAVKTTGIGQRGADAGRQQLVEQMAKERQEAQAQQEKEQAPQEAPPPPAP